MSRPTAGHGYGQALDDARAPPRPPRPSPPLRSIPQLHPKTGSGGLTDCPRNHTAHDIAAMCKHAGRPGWVSPTIESPRRPTGRGPSTCRFASRRSRSRPRPPRAWWTSSPAAGRCRGAPEYARRVFGARDASAPSAGGRRRAIEGGLGGTGRARPSLRWRRVSPPEVALSPSAWRSACAVPHGRGRPTRRPREPWGRLVSSSTVASQGSNRRPQLLT